MGALATPVCWMGTLAISGPIHSLPSDSVWTLVDLNP